MRANPRFLLSILGRDAQTLIGPASSLVTALGLAASGAFAQGSADTSARWQQRQALLETYRAKQAALLQEEQALVESGATPEQLDAWREQRASRFAAQQRRAEQMALLSACDPQPSPPAAAIPAGASPRLTAFLTARAALAGARAALHNQLVGALPADATADEIRAAQEQETQLWEQQHGPEQAAQSARAKLLAQETPGQPQPMPPLQVPADATPELVAYLVARDQLLREEIGLHNQYAGSNPATRDAALQQWRQQNAARWQQLQTLAEALPPS